IVRKPEPPQAHGRSQIIVGDPLRPEVLAPALVEHDVVISCLGRRLGQDETLLRDAAVAVLEAMVRADVRRYLVVSQGLLFPERNPIFALLRLILARSVADSAAMERLVRTSDIDWTIVRPPRLKSSGQPRGYRIRPGARPHGAWSMQRADLASFLLD